MKLKNVFGKILKFFFAIVKYTLLSTVCIIILLMLWHIIITAIYPSIHFDPHYIHIVQNYYYNKHRFDLVQDRGKNYVPGNVDTIWYNDNYILAKHQRPEIRSRDIKYPENNGDSTFYWIIDIKRDTTIGGPLIKTEYDSLLSQHHIHVNELKVFKYNPEDPNENYPY